MQQRTPIEEQIDLPFMESLRISFQSLKIRFGRSIITTAGITLGIAFLVSVWTNNEIGLALQESGRQSTINTFEETTEKGIFHERYLANCYVLDCLCCRDCQFYVDGSHGTLS